MSKRIPEVKAWDDGTAVMEKNCVPMWHLGCAAINALEERVLQLKDEVGDEWARAEQAEAELASLKAQECEGCDHDIEGVARQCARGVSVDGDIPSTDFACSRWQPREGGDE